MSRRFSMTSNPVRASESQDEAEPLLGGAEEKCDVVVEAIGFGNWSLLLVMAIVGSSVRLAASRRRDRAALRPERVAALASRGGSKRRSRGRATSTGET